MNNYTNAYYSTPHSGPQQYQLQEHRSNTSPHSIGLHSNSYTQDNVGVANTSVPYYTSSSHLSTSQLDAALDFPGLEVPDRRTQRRYSPYRVPRQPDDKNHLTLRQDGTREDSPVAERSRDPLTYSANSLHDPSLGPHSHPSSVGSTFLTDFSSAPTQDNPVDENKHIFDSCDVLQYLNGAFIPALFYPSHESDTLDPAWTYPTDQMHPVPGTSWCISKTQGATPTVSENSLQPDPFSFFSDTPIASSGESLMAATTFSQTPIIDDALFLEILEKPCASQAPHVPSEFSTQLFPENLLPEGEVQQPIAQFGEACTTNFSPALFQDFKPSVRPTGLPQHNSHNAYPSNLDALLSSQMTYQTPELYRYFNNDVQSIPNRSELLPSGMPEQPSSTPPSRPPSCVPGTSTSLAASGRRRYHPSPLRVKDGHQDATSSRRKTRRDKGKQKQGASTEEVSLWLCDSSGPVSLAPPDTLIPQQRVDNPAALQSIPQFLPGNSGVGNNTHSRALVHGQANPGGATGQALDVARGWSEPGGSRVNQVNTGFLSGANGIIMNQPTFVDASAPPVTSSQPEHSEALQWVEGHIMEGAEFDSAERVPPPHCHPGTRISIIERTNQWIDNPNRGKRLLWLRGPAGVGKSAIVQTLAEALSKSGKLGASLFFSRPNGRSNPQQVFPTIAYQLALQDKAYKAYINDLMLQKPRALKTAMAEQFRVLITEPFAQRKLRSGQGDLLVAIDGLDECNGDPIQDGTTPTLYRGRTFEQVHREIVQLISEFVQSFPSVPLVWVIASRPEDHLKAVFSSNGVKDSFVEEDIPVDSDEACRDVESYLHASFTKIRENYSSYVYETPWPTCAQFLKITRAATGLFVFAEVVIRFIGDPRVGNPISQLKYVLAAIAKLTLSSLTNPLEVLDAIYTAILDKIPDAVIANTKKLLQMMFYLQRANTKVTEFFFHDMYHYLDVSREDAIAALRHLHSVVFFPKVKDIGKTRPRFYHASFGDYLNDPLRSRKYVISEIKIDADRLVESLLPQRTSEGFTIMSTVQTYSQYLAGEGGTHENLSYQEGSYHLLAKILQSKAPSWSSGITIDLLGVRCDITDHQLQLIFEGFDISELLAQSGDTLGWLRQHLPLCEENSPSANELKCRGYLQITTLDSISMPPLTDFRIIASNGSYAFNFRGRGNTAGMIRQTAVQGRQHLLRLYSEAPKTKILLWGSQAGKQCAVIKPEDLPEWWTLLKERIYICGFTKL